MAVALETTGAPAELVLPFAPSRVVDHVHGAYGLAHGVVSMWRGAQVAIPSAQHKSISLALWAPTNARRRSGRTKRSKCRA